MALRHSSPCFTVSRVTPRSLIKAAMLPTHCHAQPKKVIKTFNFSSNTTATATKFYEDKLMGIVGYKDKSGEVIYEGFDEGPRLTHEELELICNEREARNREHIQKLIFDTIFQADNLCVKDTPLPAEKNQNTNLK